MDAYFAGLFLLFGLFLWLNHLDFKKFKEQCETENKQNERNWLRRERYLKRLEKALNLCDPEGLRKAEEEAENEWLNAHKTSEGMYDLSTLRLPKFPPIK